MEKPQGQRHGPGCGCGEAFCGTIDATAKAKATARKGGTATLIGTRILSDVRPQGDGTYKGHAFDPKRNIRAPATIRMQGGSTLVIRGCVLRGTDLQGAAVDARQLISGSTLGCAFAGLG